MNVEQPPTPSNMWKKLLVKQVARIVRLKPDDTSNAALLYENTIDLLRLGQIGRAHV